MAATVPTTEEIRLETQPFPEELRLVSLRGREALSRPPSLHLALLSERDGITPQDMIGRQVTVSVECTPPHPRRYFNGYVSRFLVGDRDTGLRGYEAEVVPWLWFLGQNSNCRIFQGMSIPQILEAVFANTAYQGLANFRWAEGRMPDHPARDYCVQYRETDLQFVSRLVEDEGLCYYIEHDHESHTLVLGDRNTAFEFCDEREVEQAELSLTPDDRIVRWQHVYEMTSGKWTETYYDFENPSRDVKTPAYLGLTQEPTTVHLPPNDRFELFEYRASGADPRVRIEEEEFRSDTIVATSTCRTFRAGGKFTISRHNDASEVGRTYVITSVEHAANSPQYAHSRGSHHPYSNSFTCIPAETPYRPARITPKPVIYGSQTAVVVGPPGEEIYTDEYGRVKVQFFWDRYGTRMWPDKNGNANSTSSCWIRCAQMSAGKGWGSMSIPRIGQEVVVTFLDGDPNQPLVTGVVYNADQMPAYSLPEHQSRSYVKTNSTPGGDGFNEIRFEDKTDEEQVFIHAERNLDLRVKDTYKERIVGDQHSIVGWEDVEKGTEGGDAKTKIYRDKHLIVKRDRVDMVEGNAFATYKQNRMELVEEDSFSSITGERWEESDEQYTRVQNDKSVVVEQGNYRIDVQGQNLEMGAADKVVIEAQNGSITLKGPGGFIKIDQTGVSIVGNLVLINSGGSAESRQTIPLHDFAAETMPEPDEPSVADDATSGQKSIADQLI